MKFYQFAPSPWKAGIVTHEIEGHKVRIYNLAKTIADCFKFRNRIGVNGARDALKIAVTERSVVPQDIMKYAKICRASLGCSTLIHEASGANSNIEKLIKDGHSSAYQAGQNAACAGVKQLFLCHFSASESASPESMKAEAGLSFKGEIIIPEPFKWYSV